MGLLERLGWEVKVSAAAKPGHLRETACSWAAVAAARFFLLRSPLSWGDGPAWGEDIELPLAKTRMKWIRDIIRWLEEQGKHRVRVHKELVELRETGGYCLNEEGMRAAVGTLTDATFEEAFERGNAVDGGFRTLTTHSGSNIII